MHCRRPFVCVWAFPEAIRAQSWWLCALARLSDISASARHCGAPTSTLSDQDVEDWKACSTVVSEHDMGNLEAPDCRRWDVGDASDPECHWLSAAAPMTSCHWLSPPSPLVEEVTPVTTALVLSDPRLGVICDLS